MLHGVHRTRRDGSSFLCHSHINAVSTPLRWIFEKRAIKKISCERSESARERGIVLYIYMYVYIERDKAINSNKKFLLHLQWAPCIVKTTDNRFQVTWLYCICGLTCRGEQTAAGTITACVCVCVCRCRIWTDAAAKEVCSVLWASGMDRPPPACSSAGPASRPWGRVW